MDNSLNQIINAVFKKVLEKSQEIRMESADLSDAEFHRRMETRFKGILREHRLANLTPEEQDALFDEVIAYITGLGPIEKFLKDPSVTEIMVNGPMQVYLERDGRIEATSVNFRDTYNLEYCIEKILAPLGKRATTFDPYVDARLSDGSRVNIILPPVSAIGPVITIRKFFHRRYTVEDLIKINTLTHDAAEFLKACVIARLNILICGGAGSGKTTLLNTLASFIPSEERIVTVEDTLELKLGGKHVIPLETRPPNYEGKGEVTIRELVRNSLHMRPDRIIVGEVRFDEVMDMIQAMNVGHEGSMTTLHANSAIDALDRLEVLMLLGTANITSEVVKRQIISAIDLVIDMSRLNDGSRKVFQICEVVKSKDYQLQDMFIYEGGVLRPSGRMPSFYNKLKEKANYRYGGS